uniref:ketosamine-3-kinase-like n=1 Tax=Styela clava TaxID=7725 RepID=UPI0019393171|nr:ketosamine-3-kinase-like [Styela clava]
MENLLKAELNFSFVKSTGQGGGGCISSGNVYDTDKGKIFVKDNTKSGAKLMFDGEYTGLRAIAETNTIRVPKPFKVIKRSHGAILVMEYLNMHSLHGHAKELGRKMAELHLSNAKNERLQEQESSYVGKSSSNFVTKFGFDTTTCCGYLPLVNDWCNNWVNFYLQNRLKPQLDMVEQKYHDSEARKLWPDVEHNFPKLFPSSLKIKPALLHGDLWGGNAAELENEPCIFDPGAFYGHSEFDLAISHMFGGFPSSFFSEYHSLIPKAEGFNERLKAYQLFHYLNHWNHFGGGYRESSLSIMRNLAKL